MRQKSTSERKRKRERVDGWGRKGEEKKKKVDGNTHGDERSGKTTRRGAGTGMDARPKIRKGRPSKNYTQVRRSIIETHHSPPVTVTLGNRSPRFVRVTISFFGREGGGRRREKKKYRTESRDRAIRAAKLAHRAILTMTSPGTYGPNSNGRKTVYRVGKATS